LLLLNQLVLVPKRPDCLVSRLAQAALDSLSLRPSHSQLLEAVCLVRKQQHPQASEASELLELQALVWNLFSSCISCVFLGLLPHCWGQMFLQFECVLPCSILATAARVGETVRSVSESADLYSIADKLWLY